MVATTDTIVSMMTTEEPRTLTDRIRRAADDLWRLLLEAHERRAWEKAASGGGGGDVTAWRA
jgi:hypothetical protein